MRFAAVAVLMLITFIVAACNGGDTASERLAANAGEDFTIFVGEQPRFDACASIGDIVNYRWTIMSAPETMAEDAGKVIREVETDCAFTLDAQMGVDEVGTWRIELSVSDASGNVDTDTVTVTVTE